MTLEEEVLGAIAASRRITENTPEARIENAAKAIGELQGIVLRLAKEIDDLKTPRRIRRHLGPPREGL